jgi:hypothetical protein
LPATIYSTDYLFDKKNKKTNPSSTVHVTSVADP